MSRLRRRAGIFTKLAVLALILYAAFNLVSLHGQIETARAARDVLEQTVAEQTVLNAVLEHEIENRYDLEMIERIARSKYGLVMPGERVFHGVAN